MFVKTIQPNGPTSSVVTGRTTHVSITTQGNTVTKLVTPQFYYADVKVTFVGINNTVMSSVIQHDTQLVGVSTLTS